MGCLNKNKMTAQFRQSTSSPRHKLDQASVNKFRSEKDTRSRQAEGVVRQLHQALSYRESGNTVRSNQSRLRKYLKLLRCPTSSTLSEIASRTMRIIRVSWGSPITSQAARCECPQMKKTFRSISQLTNHRSAQRNLRLYSCSRNCSCQSLTGSDRCGYGACRQGIIFQMTLEGTVIKLCSSSMRWMGRTSGSVDRLSLVLPMAIITILRIHTTWGTVEILMTSTPISMRTIKCHNLMSTQSKNLIKSLKAILIKTKRLPTRARSKIERLS